jgi:hypothetical protein
VLPYRAVNDVDAATVAAHLRLRRARERRKFACPIHEGRDSLHAYERGGFYCWGACGRAYSNIDVAMIVWRVTAAEACARLAATFGLVATGTYDARPFRGGAAPAQTPPLSVGRRDVIAALHRLPNPALPPVLYADFLRITDLTAPGADYLDGRGIDSERAVRDGFRSIDGRREWDELRGHFATYRLEERQAAGLVFMPWSGYAPALVIPYWFRGHVVGLRFRRLTDWTPKYSSLIEANPPLPFNADALGADEVHCVEGELNAYTLTLYDLSAVGIAGAGVWRDDWTPRLRNARRIVLWFDADEAGDRGAERVRDSLAATFGRAWVEERGRRIVLPPGEDANSLHVDGKLDDRIRRAAWR